MDQIPVERTDSGGSKGAYVSSIYVKQPTSSNGPFGKDTGSSIYVNQEQVDKQLPPPQPEFDDDEFDSVDNNNDTDLWPMPPNVVDEITLSNGTMSGQDIESNDDIDTRLQYTVNDKGPYRSEPYTVGIYDIPKKSKGKNGRTCCIMCVVLAVMFVLLIGIAILVWRLVVDDGSGVSSTDQLVGSNVDGYGPWSPYTSCSVTCGEGMRQRTRDCLLSANNCTGNFEDQTSCTNPACPVDGNWGSWGNWRACSTSCGIGSRDRSRPCDNPSPANGGQPCFNASSSIQYADCNQQACSINDCERGEWSSWKSGFCSITCGGGVREERRQRSYIVQGGPCIGNETESRTAICNTQICTNIELGDSCSGGGLCKDGNAECNNDTCACKDMHYNNGTVCVIKLDLESACTSEGQCADQNSQCADTGNGTICACKLTHFKNTTGTCTEKFALDQICSDSNECATDNAECSNVTSPSTCLCLRETHFPKEGACEEKVGLNMPCTGEDGECSDRNAECSSIGNSQICYCKDTHYVRDGTCVERTVLNKACNVTSECMIDNSKCTDVGNGKLCTCVDSHYENG
ncbi:unnamed protein product, partial [Owenia fusiformis]